MLKVIINGAAGRMGRANVAVFSSSSEVTVTGALESENSAYIGLDAGSVAGVDPIGVQITVGLEEIIDGADIIVDFTTCETSYKILEIARSHKKGVVIGTTGFTDEQYREIKKIAGEIPVLLSPNMSLGVNTLLYLVRRAAELLGEDYEAEILEIHHNKKKDAPSGTALQFARTISQARGKNLDDIGVMQRNGLIGARRHEEIGVMSLRLADVIGEHTILFGGPGERIEFAHRNTSRKTYAAGALRAARFIYGKEKGLFSMADVLGLE